MDDTIHYFSLVIDSNLFFITISIVAKLVQTREFWRIGGKESRIDARNEGGKTDFRERYQAVDVNATVNAENF